MVQRVEVQQDQQHLEHRPTEVLEVVLEVVVLIEVLEVVLEAAQNPIEVQHQEVAVIDLQEVEAQAEVAAAIEVLVVAQEARAVVQEVLAVLQDHLLAEGHLQVEVVDEDNNSQSYLKYT